MIKKLFRQMLATQIISAMTVVLCMLIDSIMIFRFLGVDSMSAYGLTTPILLVFAAFGSMISAGIQVMCGKTMASGDQKGTNACFTISVTIASAIALIGTVIVIVFSDPICALLGAGEPGPHNPVFGLTKDYLRGFIIGAPAFILSQIMVPYMQLSGNRARLVAAVIAMTVVDIAMDLLNAFVIKWGTFGMGLASSLSYYFAFVIGIGAFFRKDCVFKFRFKLFSWKRCYKLFYDGIPTLINQISLVLLTFCLNKLLMSLGGNLAVASYSLISTIGNLCYSFSSGTAAVALTLATIFYTDTDKTSLRQLVRTMSAYAVLICGIVTVVMQAAANPLVMLFTDDPQARLLAVGGMRIFVLSLVPCALNTCLKNYYQGISRIKLSMVISVCQNFLLTALAAYALSRFLKVTGVWCGYLAGETLTLIVISLIVLLRSRKNGTAFNADAYSMLPKTFGAKDSDCFECSVTSMDDIVNASQSALDFCLKKKLPSKLCMIIALSIEEMGNNIVKHGFNDGKPHMIDIRVALLKDASILRIRDNCKRFDPVKYMEMHNNDDPSKHIGIRMIMSLVQNANYVNSLGLNNLTLTL
ncbi:MAG: ATP-binding protein [Oscillospiraceae bacterium]|nr:ATP-binding protein [Oscillospiraceae bacterium]